ncbi:MAG: uroporphyrinogen-III C-methyltransferase [Candidatus Omnitrophota bacterium]
MGVKGKVYLVGAGPGDPGLLTVKAMKLLREADLVIYDFWAKPDHLRHAKEGAVKICVGKRFRHHPFSQSRINRLILSAARKGQKVVRLKGGDPYLFGRGGEEALVLVKHRIPFEVVPGVTSATACAAYSGIPLTHREHNSTVTFLTGHRAHDRNLDTIDWEKVVALRGPIVIYMGLYNLGKIVERLVEAGMPPRTRVSVIQWGTLPTQRSCDGDLRTIARRVKERRLGAPSIIIVGDVVSLKKELNWYEKLPLFGKTVVVTRTRPKAGALAEKLAELGARVLEFPTIEIGGLSDYSEMDAAIRDLGRFDWIIFTSTYGVKAFFERLEKVGRDVRSLGAVRVASVGPETSRSLREKGVHPDLEPARFETAAVVETFRRRFGDLREKKILLFRTNIAPVLLEDGLKKLGARVKRVTAYTTKFPGKAPAEVKKELLAGGVDIVTFTSSSTAENFIRIIGLKNVRKIARRARFASIGPVTSRTLKAHGLKPACQAKIFTTDGLVSAIAGLNGRKP